MSGRWVNDDGTAVLLSSADSGTMLPVGHFIHAGSDSSAASSSSAHQIALDLPDDVVVDRIGLVVAAQSGNIDVGIYDDDGTGGIPGTLLVATGSIACPAVGPQLIPITEIALLAGRIWLALAVNSGGSRFVNCVPTVSGSGPFDPATGTVTAPRRGGSAFPLADPAQSSVNTTVGFAMWLDHS